MPERGAEVVVVLNLSRLWRESPVFREDMLRHLVGTTIEPVDWDDEPEVITREVATMVCVAQFASLGLN